MINRVGRSSTEASVGPAYAAEYLSAIGYGVMPNYDSWSLGSRALTFGRLGWASRRH